MERVLKNVLLTITILTITLIGYVKADEVVNVPTNLTVSSHITGNTITYNNVDGVTGYKIYKSTSKTGTFSLLTTTALTTYKDTAISAGKTYYYKVSAYKEENGVIKESGLSNYAYKTVVVPNPTSFKISISSATSLKITAANSDGISGIEIAYRPSTTSKYTYKYYNKASSYYISSLTSGRVHYVKVRYYVLVGKTKVYSSYSQTYSILPRPLPMTNLKTTSTDYRTNYLSYTKQSGISGYEIYYSVNSTSSFKYLTRTTSTTYKHYYLTPTYTYYYKVRAYKTVGSTRIYGSFSSVMSTKPVMKTPKLSVATSNNSTLKLSFSGVSGASGYNVYRSTSINGTYSYIGYTTKTYYSDTKLSSNKTYYYKVRAYRKVGSKKVYSSYSNLSYSLTAPSIPSYSLSSYDHDAIKLTIKPVSGAVKYHVYRSTSKTGTYSYVGYTTNTTFINTKLTTGRTYYYKIRAINAYNNSNIYSSYSNAYSSVATVKTPSFTIKNDDNINTVLTISKVNGATRYQVYRATAKGGSYAYLGSTTSTFTDTNVVDNKTYYYKVRAYKTVRGKNYYSNYYYVTYTMPKYYQNGTYTVGKHITPGLYRVIVESMYSGEVVRLNGPGSGMESVNAQNLFYGPGYVEVKANDYAIKVTGAILYKIDYNKYNLPFKTTYNSGKYLVGKDIQPGLYKISDIVGYYTPITRLSSVDMEESSKITFDILRDNGYIEIKNTDYAVEFSHAKLTKIDYNAYNPVVKDVYTKGTYLVGKDILPGQYKITFTSQDNVFTRLSKVDYEPSSVIYSNTFLSEATVTIEESDYAIRLENATLTKIN